jgi:glycosyltransferase involved in cell wall biosynthesis
MKIAFLSTFFPFRGGIAQFNAAIYRELEKQHEVKAYTFKRQYPDFLFPGETQYVTEQDQVDEIPATRILDTINPFSYASTAKAIKREQPDVLIMKYWMTFFAPSLGWVAKRLKKNTVTICVLDNLIPHEKRFFDTAFNRFFVKQIDGFVVMSDKVLEDLLLTHPTANYLRIDHPLYDHFGAIQGKSNACKHLNLNPEKKYALFFGFIRDYKGLDLLIDAMKTVSEDVELIVAGEVYGSFQKYEQQIAQAGLSNRIHVFNRYISDAEVAQFYGAADVCVLPYKSATQSGITAISFHFEVPIIATNVGGLAETVKHQKTGVVVDSPDSSLIATAINTYFKEDLKEAMVTEIQQYKQEHSWKKFAEQLVDFAKEMRSKKH